MKDVLNYLDEIQPAADGGYTLTDEARAFFEPYLHRYGINLDKLTTRRELFDSIGFCNAEEFAKLVSRPAPTLGLRFIWNRLRKLGQPG